MENSDLNRHRLFHKVIMSVKKHPLLWNKNDINYNANKAKREATWRVIAEEVNIPVNEVHRIWHGLRIRYRRVYRLEREGRPARWQFYSDMEFLREMMGWRENEFQGIVISDSEDDSQQLSKQSNLIKRTTIASTTTTQTITTTCSSDLPSTIAASVLTLPPYDDAETTSSCVKNATPSDDLEFIPNAAKQEPELYLELRIADDEVEKQVSLAPEKDNEYAEEFQEHLVSTSCHKRSRVSVEQSSDTSLPPIATTSQIMPQSHPPHVYDDDYYFVMSILSSLRQIPRNRKISLRIGIMGVIEKNLDTACGN